MTPLLKKWGLLGLLLVAQAGCYVTRLAYHHVALLSTRRPVTEVIDDRTTPEKTRLALLECQAVLDFATKEGLKAEGAYTQFIQSPTAYVSYLVQAAEVDRLVFKEWWFPVVGSVPYLGYFSMEERDAKARDLKNEGFDVTTSGVGAFSSLGWFDDPIYSSMLHRNPGDLAHLLFHELVHRTIWIKGSTEFNENLAEYAALALTRAYLEHKKDQTTLNRYLKKQGDKERYRLWLFDLKTSLKNLYETHPPRPRQQQLAAKKRLFAEYLNPPRRPRFDTVDYIGHGEWNNATVLAEALYAPDTESFAKAHRCLGAVTPLKAFFEALQEAATKENTSDPQVILKSLCQQEA